MILLQTTKPPENVQDIFYNLKVQFLGAIPGLVSAFIVLFIFWLIAVIGARIIAYAAPRAKANTDLVLLLSRVYYYTILTFGIITALSATGLDVSALIAGLGLTGFALGFALKDVLANFLSGIMLLVYRPFQIGDNITMGQYTGTIQTIRVRDTILHDDEGRVVVIPNSKLITEVVVNNRNATKKASYINEGSSETAKEEKSATDGSVSEIG